MASDSEEEPEQLQYKVILIGNGTVGKTSLVRRFIEEDFGHSYKQTIGLDFFIKQLVLPGDVQVALQVWDIGGQTIGGKMLGNYIYGAQAVLLVYDVTNYNSFQDLEDWFGVVKKTFKGEEMPYVALIGNKSDLSHMRVVKPDKHNDFADSNEMYSYFVSAKTGDGVSRSFNRIAADLSGVVLTKAETDVTAKPVKAEIVSHPNGKNPAAVADTRAKSKPARADPPAPANEEMGPAEIPSGDAGGKKKKKKGGGGCIVM